MDFPLNRCSAQIFGNRPAVLEISMGVRPAVGGAAAVAIGETIIWLTLPPHPY